MLVQLANNYISPFLSLSYHRTIFSIIFCYWFVGHQIRFVFFLSLSQSSYDFSLNVSFISIIKINRYFFFFFFQYLINTFYLHPRLIANLLRLKFPNLR